MCPNLPLSPPHPQVHYLERVNAELHDLLEKYEGEFFNAQSTLEADRSSADTRAAGLQEEVVRLQERINALLASRELGDTETQRLLRASTQRGEGGIGGRGNARRVLDERDQLIAMVREAWVCRWRASAVTWPLGRMCS